MAGPVSINNTRGQSTDVIVKTDGTSRSKLAIGDVSVSLDDNAAWQGVATHVDDDTFGANDGIVIVGGVDETDGVTPRRTIVDVNGRLVVSPVVAPGAFTDGSGTLGTGGVSEQMMASNTDRKYLLIQNTDPSEEMWINFGVAAVVGQPSLRIPANGDFVMEGSFISSQSINIIAATTSHPWTAKEAG